MSGPEPELSRWFEEEVLPHESSLRAWLFTRFPTLPDVDDLVQETFSRLLKANATGSIAHPRGFLFVTARNLALNQLRHLRYVSPADEPAPDPEWVADERGDVPAAVAHAEDLRLLTEAIRALPERCRQVLTLRKIYGLSQRETALRLGISEHTVEVQGAIGLRKCIRFFRERGHRT